MFVGRPKSRSAPLPRGLTVLPLANRYHAAWLEYVSRTSLRQNLIQIHLASAGVLFGYYFHTGEPANRNAALFLLAGITLLTVSTSLLLGLHFRSSRNLCRFLQRCEQYAESDLGDNDRQLAQLIYFSSPESA